MLRGTRFNVSEKIAMGELISKSSGRPTGLGSWCILLVNKLCTHKQWVVYKRTYIRPYRHHTQLITDQWVNVKRISNLKSHKLNTWVFLTHSLQPHQIFDHTNWCTWCTTNLNHWLTHSLKPHQNMVWVFFSSLQTLYNHTKVLTTPNDVKQTWHTLSNHTKLWPHQIDVRVQQTKVHCDHTNIILMFLSDTRHHSFIPQHSITLNVIIGTTSNDTTTPNLTKSHHPPWPTFSSTLPTG